MNYQKDTTSYYSKQWHEKRYCINLIPCGREKMLVWVRKSFCAPSTYVRLHKIWMSIKCIFLRLSRYQKIKEGKLKFKRYYQCEFFVFLSDAQFFHRSPQLM